VSEQQLEQLIKNPPTLEQIREWARTTFKGHPSVYEYVYPERERVPKFLLDARDLENNHVIIRAESGVFFQLCGAYMLLTGWQW